MPSKLSDPLLLRIGALYIAVNGDIVLLLGKSFGTPKRVFVNPYGIPGTTVSPQWIDNAKNEPLVSLKFWNLNKQCTQSLAFPEWSAHLYFREYPEESEEATI